MDGADDLDLLDKGILSLRGEWQTISPDERIRIGARALLLAVLRYRPDGPPVESASVRRGQKYARVIDLRRQGQNYTQISAELGLAAKSVAGLVELKRVAPDIFEEVVGGNLSLVAAMRLVQG